jgi:hypothetical protein
MSNLYRGPSRDASYQVSVHLAKQFLFFLIGQSLKIFSETAQLNEPKLGGKHLWKAIRRKMHIFNVKSVRDKNVFMESL